VEEELRLPPDALIDVVQNEYNRQLRKRNKVRRASAGSISPVVRAPPSTFGFTSPSPQSANFLPMPPSSAASPPISVPSPFLPSPPAKAPEEKKRPDSIPPIPVGLGLGLGLGLPDRARTPASPPPELKTSSPPPMDNTTPVKQKPFIPSLAIPVSKVGRTPSVTPPGTAQSSGRATNKSPAPPGF
jgi:hypothetical protein